MEPTVITNAITDQPDMVPLTTEMRALMERLIEEFERLEVRIAEQGDRFCLAYSEQAGIRTALAYMTGLHLITTPGGGVGDWLPTLKHVLKESRS